MARFILNSHAQANGDNEVHNATTGCICMPIAAHQLDLGEHVDGRSAVAHARQQWPSERISGCAYCCSVTPIGQAPAP